jgi:hypothetical protein
MILPHHHRRGVMPNRHRSRDVRARVVYIYLSDLEFFEWSDLYLSRPSDVTRVTINI